MNESYGNDRSRAATSRPTIPPDLTKKLLQQYDAKKGGSTKRVSQETTKAISEVLRVFVVEARARASIEAECDIEGEGDDASNNDPKSLVPIRAEHITKVAAELLMDFA